MLKRSSLLEEISLIAKKAGLAVMEVYESEDFGVEFKEDDSPLTHADKAANEIIVEELSLISDHPIISEENEQRDPGDNEFWLVDPLDGTREFINRNGEFTVNIGLIRDDKPVLGVVYVPVTGVLYCGDVDQGVAYKIDANGEMSDIKASGAELDPPVVVASRSHMDPRTEKLLKEIGDHEIISMGSSLKLCLVAEGKATIYPRIAPTWLWDTAAADAVVTAAGGRIKNLDGEVLKYVPEDNMKNPFFVVECADNKINWKKYL